MKKTLIVYCDESGNEPFSKWLSGLRDPLTRARISRRLRRLEESGHWGEIRSVGDGVFELKLDFGPGYRIYLGEDKKELIILLCGGDKGSQDRDIVRAKELWKKYKGART